MSGDNNCGINAIYCKSTYGVSIPFLRNTLTRNAFEFIRKYMHLSDYANQKQKGDHGYDPLFKVCALIDMVMTGL